MKEPYVLLRIALLIATLGMALVVLGVIQGALFFPGVVILTLGGVGAGAAGVFASVRGS